MSSAASFVPTDPGLLPVLEELSRFEPIFHTPDFGRTPADFARRMAPGYWETGASGRRYSRAFVLEMFKAKAPALAPADWYTSGHALQQLAPHTFLLTYTLAQGPRLTRRATVWQRSNGDWRILYHQGTIVTPGEDDTAPPPL